jgi:hypothetical protein
VPNVSTRVFTGARNIPQPDEGALKPVVIQVDFPSTAFAANDLVFLTRIPIGVAVQDYEFHFPDIDTGTPAFAFSFGVCNAGLTDLATVYASGLTAGQSTAIVRATTTVAAQDATTAERVLALKITTIAATYAGSGAVGQVVLHLRG